MALIECEECGSAVSHKAIVCPNCGYGVSEQFDWAVSDQLALTVIAPIFGYFVICLSGIYFGFFDYSNSFFQWGGSNTWLWIPLGFMFMSMGQSRVGGGWLPAFGACWLIYIAADWIIPEDSGKKEPLSAAVNTSGWSTSYTSDVMTGVKTYHAISNQTVALEPLKSGYSDVKTRMGFSCQPSNGFQIYFVFNLVNIPRTRYENGGRYIDARVKFDDNIETYPLLIIEAAEDSLYFTSDLSPTLYLENESSRTLLSKLYTSKSALLRLEYHNNGYVHFRYDLNGRGEIAQTVADCGLIPKKS